MDESAKQRKRDREKLRYEKKEAAVDLITPETLMKIDRLLLSNNPRRAQAMALALAARATSPELTEYLSILKKILNRSEAYKQREI